MSILNDQKSRTGFKLIGMSVHLDIHHYLTVYSLAKGIKKAKLLKDMLDTWIMQEKLKDGDGRLLKEIAQRAMDKWKIEKKNGINRPLSEFKEILGKELQEKGLTEGEIKRVLTLMM
jgi:hypothetical protein